MSRVRDLAAPMHLGLINWPFVPHVQSREPRSITEAPDGPQAYTLNILRLEEGAAQMCMSEWGEGLTYIKNVGRGFLQMDAVRTYRLFAYSQKCMKCNPWLEIFPCLWIVRIWATNYAVAVFCVRGIWNVHIVCQVTTSAAISYWKLNGRVGEGVKRVRADGNWPAVVAR